jgi:hypothetical protein
MAAGFLMSDAEDSCQKIWKLVLFLVPLSPKKQMKWDQKTN